MTHLKPFCSNLWCSQNCFEQLLSLDFKRFNLAFSISNFRGGDYSLRELTWFSSDIPFFFYSKSQRKSIKNCLLVMEVGNNQTKTEFMNMEWNWLNFRKIFSVTNFQRNKNFRRILINFAVNPSLPKNITDNSKFASTFLVSEGENVFLNFCKFIIFSNSSSLDWIKI